MSLIQRLLMGGLLALLGIAIRPAVSFAAITNTSNELRVASVQLAKVPQSCSSTLSVTIRNNGSTPTDSGLFLHADQYRSLGGTLRQSRTIPGQRVPVLAPGQTEVLHFTFIREHDKTNVGFRFMVGAATVAMADGLLPPFNETYSASIVSYQLDRAANRFTSSITNTGSWPLPKPAIQLYVARQSAPTTFAPQGGGIVTTCLMPGATAQYGIPVNDAASIAGYRIQLYAAGKTLADKTVGGTPNVKPNAIRLKPVIRKSPLIQPR